MGLLFGVCTVASSLRAHYSNSSQFQGPVCLFVRVFFVFFFLFFFILFKKNKKHTPKKKEKKDGFSKKKSVMWCRLTL
jgi:ATP/ADP translocase